MSKKSASGSPRSSGDPDTESQSAQGRGKNVVFYDGVCTFCDGTVRFLYDLDTHRTLAFATLQSELGTSLINAHPKTLGTIDSIIFVTAYGTEVERIDIKSTGILRILETLGGPWRLLAPLRVVPRFLRDPLYEAFAARRYKWFGKKNLDHCMIPGPEDAGRFFD